MRERWASFVDGVVAVLVAVLVIIVILAAIVATSHSSWMTLLAAALVTLAFIWLRIYHRTQCARLERAGRMLCPGCEYDLRGAVPDEHAKVHCPECGFAGTTHEIESAWERRHPDHTGAWNERAWKNQ